MGRNGTGATVRPSSSHRIASSTAPEALAAVLLGDGDAGPAELRQLAPQALVGAARLGVLAHALGPGAVGQQLARGALDVALVVGQSEVHGSAS